MFSVPPRAASKYRIVAPLFDARTLCLTAHARTGNPPLLSPQSSVMLSEDSRHELAISLSAASDWLHLVICICSVFLASSM